MGHFLHIPILCCDTLCISQPFIISFRRVKISKGPHNTSRSPDECAEDGLMFNDDYLKRGNVGRAAGVEEERSKMSEFRRV